MSNRWRDDLTPAQQRILDELLQNDLERYGYASPLPPAPAKSPTGSAFVRA